MSGNCNALGNVDRVDESCPTSSSFSSVHCDPGKATSSPPPSGSGWLHLQNWKLKRLLEEQNSENEKLKRLLTAKEAEIEMLTEKMKRMEAELVSEVEASGDLVVDMVEGKEEAAKKLMEKDAEIQELRKSVRRAEIQNHQLRTAELETSSTVQIQNHLESPEEAEKVCVLFPDVLKILIEKERKFMGCTVWRNLVPLLTTCRLVCKSWRESVDLIMQQDSSHTDLCHNYIAPTEFKEDFTPSPLKLSYSTRWSDLSRLPSPQKGNPIRIPTRHLLIAPGPSHAINFQSEKWASYCRIVKRFLKMAGEQVWYLTLDFGGNDDTFEDCRLVYKCISEWLSLVPNLRSLSLFTWIGEKEKMQKWRKKLKKIKFPKLQDLVTFQGYQDTHLCFAILKNNRHIRKLGISSTYEPHNLPSLLGAHFPNLSTVQCNFHHVEGWKTFVHPARNRLAELSVGFYGIDRPTPQQFMEGLAKLGKTLKSLTFNISQVTRGNLEQLGLNLLQLKHLHLISEDWRPLSLEPILMSLDNLETFSYELSIMRRPCNVTHPSELDKQDFLDYVNNFRDKTDWMKLHKLKHVKLTVKFNGEEIGDQKLYLLERADLPFVRFDIVKIDEIQIEYYDFWEGHYD